MVNKAKQVDLGEVLAKYGGKSPAMVNEAKQFDPDEFLAKYPQWSWQMKIEAAGTNKR
jgi:hypothetical protein